MKRRRFSFSSQLSFHDNSHSLEEQQHDHSHSHPCPQPRPQYYPDQVVEGQFDDASSSSSSSPVNSSSKDHCTATPIKRGKIDLVPYHHDDGKEDSNHSVMKNGKNIDEENNEKTYSGSMCTRHALSSKTANETIHHSSSTSTQINAVMNRLVMNDGSKRTDTKIFATTTDNSSSKLNEVLSHAKKEQVQPNLVSFEDSYRLEESPSNEDSQSFEKKKGNDLSSSSSIANLDKGQTASTHNSTNLANSVRGESSRSTTMGIGSTNDHRGDATTFFNNNQFSNMEPMWFPPSSYKSRSIGEPQQQSSLERGGKGEFYYHPYEHYDQQPQYANDFGSRYDSHPQQLSSSSYYPSWDRTYDLRMRNNPNHFQQQQEHQRQRQRQQRRDHYQKHQSYYPSEAQSAQRYLFHHYRNHREPSKSDLSYAYSFHHPHHDTIPQQPYHSYPSLYNQRPATIEGDCRKDFGNTSPSTKPAQTTNYEDTIVSLRSPSKDRVVERCQKDGANKTGQIMASAAKNVDFMAQDTTSKMPPLNQYGMYQMLDLEQDGNFVAGGNSDPSDQQARVHHMKQGQIDSSQERSQIQQQQHGEENQSQSDAVEGERIFPSSITPDDVLLGRGGGTNRHNVRFRKLVSEAQPQYILSRKKEKTAIAKSIVARIRSRNGRFLKMHQNTKYYFEVGDKQAATKTSQALREGLSGRMREIVKVGEIGPDLR